MLRNNVFLCNFHHLVFDGWSVDVFLREIGAFYGAVTVEGAPVPPLKFQYADVAMWQRQRLQEERFVQQMDYWRHQLSGYAGYLALPTDRPRSAKHGIVGQSITFALDSQIVEQLLELARDEQSTLFIVILAAFQALLHQQTGQVDIAVGAPFAGRNHSAFEKLIGYFVNTLVLRSQVEQSLTFREVLARTRRTVLDALADQDVPFDKLVEELQPARSPSTIRCSKSGFR